MRLGHPFRLRSRWAALAALLGIALSALVAAGPATADGHVSELVLFEEGQFPEGLTVAPDGTILVGIASTGEIVRVTPNGTASVFAQVPIPEGAFLLGLAAIDATNLYALVSAGDANHGVWRVTQHGASVTQLAELPAGTFPNDLTLDATGQLFVTDSIGGQVFKVGPDGSVEVWAEDPLLLGNVEAPGPIGFPIGANGIALTPDGDGLYVAVSEGERIVRIPFMDDGSAGPLTVVAEDAALNGADGIDVDDSGRVYAAVNGQNQIARVDPATGSVEVVASGSIFRFPAVLRFSPDFETLYVTNFDAPVLLGLAPGPARTGLLAIDVSALEAQPAPITPPATGDAGLKADGNGGLATGLAMLGLVGVMSTAWALRRRWTH